MLTTFARIAKILKGLVEPRNWVEEAFAGAAIEYGGESSVSDDDFPASWNDINRIMLRGNAPTFKFTTGECGTIVSCFVRDGVYSCRVFWANSQGTLKANSPDEPLHF